MTKRFPLLIASFLLGILILGSGCAQAAESKVLVPTNRAVYQRNDKNKADLLVRVKADEGSSVSASVSDADKPLSETIALAPTAEDASVYEGIIPNIPAGGWYQMTIQTTGTDQTEPLTQTIEQIGVGEVFITGGQSNSCSMGWDKTSATSDLVSAFDPQKDQWVHCEDPQPCISGFGAFNGYGSPWPSAGDELYEELQVPIGFITTGYGGSTVAELARTQAEAKEEEPDNSQAAGHYDAIYDAITTLHDYGYRALLFHQGEGDTGQTSKESYAASLTKLILRTRADAGFDLPWMVANVAYNPHTSLEQEAVILEAQQSVCEDDDLFPIFLGPGTDDMTYDTGHRGDDKLHFNLEGLKEHGHRWAVKIVENLIPDYSQLPPEETPAPSETPDPAKPSESSAPVESEKPADLQPTTAPTASVTPAVPAVTNAPAPTQPDTTESNVPSSNKGKTFKSGMFQYKITSDSKGNTKVKITAITIKSKKSITIPKKVKYKGISYQISAIDKQVLKKLSKIKQIKLPSILYKLCKTQWKGKKITIKKY